MATIFSSVTHLGSDPALITITLRPNTVEMHSFENMVVNLFFTINHISSSIIKQAHQTSARYAKNKSEFDATNLNAEYLNSYKIEENGCLIVVASIE